MGDISSMPNKLQSMKAEFHKKLNIRTILRNLIQVSAQQVGQKPLLVNLSITFMI